MTDILAGLFPFAFAVVFLSIWLTFHVGYRRWADGREDRKQHEVHR